MAVPFFVYLTHQHHQKVKKEFKVSFGLLCCSIRRKGKANEVHVHAAEPVVIKPSTCSWVYVSCYSDTRSGHDLQKRLFSPKTVEF